MSEELLQTTPHPLVRYQYYVLGATTLAQLRKEKIISVKVPPEVAKNKPDGLIVVPNGATKAYIEYKQPSELASKKQREKAIAQEIEAAKALCKVLIVSDGDKSFWINTLTGREITEKSDAKLKTFNAKRILDGKLTTEEVVELEDLLDRIDHSLSATNDAIFAPSLLDPSPLARAIWQKIWINTGKEPEKCLYNVVELFVFKFLSDIGVLKAHNNFNSVYALTKSASDQDALKHYAQICRRDIRDLFPAGPDGTTIINGTIFVNEKGEPNLSQSRLFGELLKALQVYSDQRGSFKYIQREFKTRLYESFLRQEAGVRFLGQYLTPRNVVLAMVAMSPASNLTKGARICDPFCGVGGFILETIVGNPSIYGEFEPHNGVVNPRISLVGFDKGTDEKDDERTIILAKANMLIYFSDLLVKYNSPKYLKAFSDGAFNKTFTLIRSNLGTFGRVEEEPFDLILTNPPYVTSGSNSLKRAIEEEGLAKHYTASGRGTEALAVEWVIRNLKPGGNAFIVVPDGLLNQTAMLEFIKFNCVVRAIISLPQRTFYATPKKTYILAFTRKLHSEEAQTDPVLTYLVSEIGETRDAKRFKIERNDLEEAASLYNQFKGSPKYFTTLSPRCKIVSFAEFSERQHWLVERWWAATERVTLGITDESSIASEEEFEGAVRDLQGQLAVIAKQAASHAEGTESFREVCLSDETLFHLTIGDRVLKKDVIISGVPVYSANVSKPFGFVAKAQSNDFSHPSLLWGIDGIFDWGYVPESIPFVNTDHCGVLQVVGKYILPKYVYYALRATKDQYGFDRTFRANLDNMKVLVRVQIPINAQGNFDTEAQKRIVERYEQLEKVKKMLTDKLEALSDMQVVLE